MLFVGSVVTVDEAKCIGCKACDRVCPTEAIVTVDKLARVDEPACTGCNKCIEACMDHGAISRKFMKEPVLLRSDIKAVPAEKIDALCAEARLFPEHVVCPCTGTKAGEVASAVLQGAQSPAECSVASGVRGVCSMWCTSAVLRLLRAAGREVEPTPKNWRIYPDGLGPGIWNIPEDIAERYPEYRIKESQGTLATGRLPNMGFPAIREEGKR
jgi:Fe-S-cluster-containing hydrogenase component 2